MNPALADILTRPDVWRGEALAVAPLPALASGFAELDAELPGGGWPRGQLTELLYERPGIGETALLVPALARVTALGGAVMMIADPNGRMQFHAPAWAAAGVRLEHVFWVRTAQPADALRAAVDSLRCRGVALTVLWATQMTQRMLRGSDVLRRLHVAAGEGGGAAFMYRHARDAGQASPAPLRLQLTPCGDVLQVDLLKRRGAPLRRPLRLSIPRPALIRRAEFPRHVLDFDHSRAIGTAEPVLA